jgi:hypothetical protein
MKVDQRPKFARFRRVQYLAQALLFGTRKEAPTMSQQMVGVAIHTLLTDDDLRDRFVLDPMEALVALNVRGVELTKDEIDVFVRTDARLWFWTRDLFHAREH